MENTANQPPTPTWGTAIRHRVSGLFPEARGLERRRRLRYAALLLVLVAAGAVALLKAVGPDHARPVAGHDGRPTVKSIRLPTAEGFSSLALVDGRLMLLGGIQASSLVYGYPSELADGRAVGTCDAASVDPRTLAIGRPRSANCGDPALYGERVLPLTYFSHAAPGLLSVRIARADARARDGYTVGPVVTSYQECSDCQAAMIYGDGSLWIYNPTGRHAGRSGEVLRISTETGTVLERWKMPTILRALLAVNSRGLWLSPSIESSQVAPAGSLYRIRPGDRTPRRVLADPEARWLLASGDTVAAAIDRGHGQAEVWTLAPGRKPVHGPTLSDGPMGAELGTGGPTVAGNPQLGYYNVVAGDRKESVIQITPNGGQERTIATFRSRGATDSYPAVTSVSIDGSLFFIDPTTNPHQHSDLHRVTPSSHP
jgi:hypothetical protein